MEKHFCVSVYVFDSQKGKFLLVNHKKLGKWMQPGGHLEANEDPQEAAVRETFEETGIEIQLIGENVPRRTDYIRPLALQKNTVAPGHIHMDFVYMAVPAGGVLTLNKKETNGIGWFSVEEIQDRNFNTFEDIRVWCLEIAKILSVN